MAALMVHVVGTDYYDFVMRAMVFIYSVPKLKLQILTVFQYQNKKWSVYLM